MNADWALQRGMDAIEGHGRITVPLRSGDAKPKDKKDPEAHHDADAWNMLRHLSTIL